MLLLTHTHTHLIIEITCARIEHWSQHKPCNDLTKSDRNPILVVGIVCIEDDGVELYWMWLQVRLAVSHTHTRAQILNEAARNSIHLTVYAFIWFQRLDNWSNVSIVVGMFIFLFNKRNDNKSAVRYILYVLHWRTTYFVSRKLWMLLT